MSGILGWAIGPLVRVRTYRQWVHLLLGGVLLLPYLGLAVLFFQSFRPTCLPAAGRCCCWSQWWSRW